MFSFFSFLFLLSSLVCALLHWITSFSPWRTTREQHRGKWPCLAVSARRVETDTLDVTIFIEPFNLACCEASNPIRHFTLPTQYDESITKWSMKGFTLCLPTPPLLSNHSNRTRINLLFSETTQESSLDLIISPALFPCCQASAEMIWEADRRKR